MTASPTPRSVPVAANADRAHAHGARRVSGESGVVLPMVGIALIVLLGLTAFALDLGLAFNQRRQNQAAVDAAAISGAYTAAYTGLGAGDAIFDDVTRVSYNSLNGVGTLEEWRAAFRTCVDPDRLEQVLSTSAGDIDCISYTRGTFRVRLPDTEVPSIFRGAAGFQPLTTTAAAEVSGEPTSTNILPFAMSASSASDSTIICLKNPPGGHANVECPGPSTGQFNDLDIPRPFTNESNQACNGGHQTIIRENVAMGVDHEMAIYDPAGIEIRDECTNPGDMYPNPAGSNPANTVNASTGNQPSNVEYGLLTGNAFSDGRGGRLTRTPYETTTVGDWFNIDDRPLWTFIGSFSESQTVDMSSTGLPLSASARTTKIPRSCWLLQRGIVVQNKTTMQFCMEEYDLGQFTTDLFTADTRNPGDGTLDIQESPRFAWLPMAPIDLATQCSSGSNCWYRISDFRPVFVQTLYWGKVRGGSTTIQARFDPGESVVGTPGRGKQFAGASAFSFNIEMLPQSILDRGFSGVENEIVLTR